MEAQSEALEVPALADGFPANVHRTKIPLSELNPETIKYLTNWRPPNHAYILFEKREYHLTPDMKKTLGTGLFTLTVEHRPEQEQKLNYYILKKKFRLIDWGNFPKASDANPQRAAKARMYSGQNGANPWDFLEQAIQTLITANPGWKDERAALIERERGLKAKITEMEKRLKKGEATNGKGNG